MEDKSTASEGSSTSSPEPANELASSKTTKSKTNVKTDTMVYEAIKQLASRGGSTLPAIKKYISTTYDVDVQKRANLIRKYLKSAVSEGLVIETKRTGSAAHYRLPYGKTVVAGAKADAKKAQRAAKKEQTSTETDTKKVSSSTKRQASSKVAETVSSTSTRKKKKSETSVSPQSPLKMKKTSKLPASKLTSPKPRKVNAVRKSPKVSIKKMAATSN